MKIPISILVISLFILSSCNKKDYIIYYNKVNQIDSTYRLANNPQLAIEKYQELFKEYEPRNQEKIEEYSTYILLSDRYNKDFGGKKSLDKLIPLIAPYDNKYKEYLPLFKKYGIANTEVKEKIADWKKELNQQLIDSFSIAFKRDQAGRPYDTITVRKNVKKNANLFKWTFEKFGFPSQQKIGSFPMITLLSHMSESKTAAPYLEKKVLEYVRSGDCPPLYYAMMVDGRGFSLGKETYYGMGRSFLKKIDSATINQHRKNVGFPSLKHAEKLKRDYFSSIKNK